MKMRSSSITLLLIPTPLINGFVVHNARTRQTSIPSYPTLLFNQEEDEEYNIYLDDEASNAFFQKRTSSSLSTPSSLQTNANNQRNEVVRRWLLFYLPRLKPHDVEIYTREFIKDGFDTEEMLDVVVEEDLEFMKVVSFWLWYN